MVPQGTQKKAATLAIAIIAFSGLAMTLIHAKPTLSSVKNLNLFKLVGNMDHTTTTMLQNTRSLQQQVIQVSKQLSQLRQQEHIIGQQVQTGQQLQASLNTQVNRTQTDVTLMKQILQTENITAARTKTIAAASQGVTGEIIANTQNLSKLQLSLHASVSQSSALNRKLDTMLHELSSSEQEFKLFGQVNQLLPGVLSSANGSSNKSSVSSLVKSVHGTTSNVVKSTQSSLNKLLP